MCDPVTMAALTPMHVMAATSAATLGHTVHSSGRQRRAQKRAVRKADAQRAADQATLESNRKKSEKGKQASLVQQAALQQRKKLALNSGGRKSTMLTDQSSFGGPEIKDKTLLGS